jgi:hypothetical protein
VLFFLVSVIVVSFLISAFKTGTAGNTSNEEVICVTNCCITGYTTTLNADGVQEETLEFSSYQPAVYGLSGDELNKSLTATGDF